MISESDTFIKVTSIYSRAYLFCHQPLLAVAERMSPLPHPLFKVLLADFGYTTKVDSRHRKQRFISHTGQPLRRLIIC